MKLLFPDIDSQKVEELAKKMRFSLDPSYVESTSRKSSCRSVCLSSLRDSEYRLFISSGLGSRQTPHFCWAEDVVSCHLAMSMTHTKTKTQTKANTKCLKYPMYVIYLKRGFKYFKYDMDMSDMDVMDMDVVDSKTKTKT